MTEEQIKQICDDNFTYLMMLGYVSGILIDYRETLKYEEKNVEKIDWFLKSIENKIYLKTPIPPMP